MKRVLALSGLLISAVVLLGAAYNVSTPAPVVLQPGNCMFLIQTADGAPPATNFKSQEFQIKSQALPNPANAHVSMELIWSGNPGAGWEIDIQDADTDADGNFVQLPVAGTVTSTPVTSGGAFVSRVEFSPWAAGFGRLFVKTQSPNAVSLQARACR